MSQSQSLDLSITLSPLPEGSPPENIAIITLHYDQQGLMHIGDILSDPLRPNEYKELRWYLEDYWKWPYEQFLMRGKQVEGLLEDIGKRLYKAVFGSTEARDMLQAWRLQPDADRQISIISEVPRALSLPWELLHDEQGFLVLRTRHPVSILRRLPQREAAALLTPFDPPLRILLVTARPEGAGFIDPRSTARELLDEVQGQVDAGAVEIEFLRPPTRDALRKRLQNTKRPVHVLHFDGHGIFEGPIDPKNSLNKVGGEQGKLAFEDAQGKLDLVKAEDLAQILLDSGVRLAVLDACQSAMGSSENAFSSVATRLIQSGVDAVVAMSASVLVASSTRFFETFYRELAAGTPAPTAQERARQALYDDPRRHLMSRRRDEEGQPVELRDWWLPHFYQQRPLELRPTRPSGRLHLQQAAPERLSESMPAEPRYGFTGRSYELLQIERYLLHGKLVVIHGFGGNGKTALAREAADWLTRTKMYERACFVSFEHGGDATMLLSALGNFMDVYDGNYNPNDSKVALARLKTALKTKPTLVIVDNLESILPGGDTPLEIAVRTQFWDVLLELSKMSAGVLLTSRDIAFGDGRMAQGKNVAHLALSGLWPEDAYTLASALLNDLGIDRAKAPFAELRDLLIQLDHHPLSIQLVLPALDEYSIAKIRADFATLLSKFEDDTETGRNRSLLASLDYSLRRLSREQRELLPRLALFEGGASEDDLLAITEIPEVEWAKLRPALEQAALLTAEQIGNFTAPFLRFHPVLALYLRSQPGADDAALRERYVRRYYELANYLYREDDRNPQPVRALVQKELSNLQRALELLLEGGEMDDASEMAKAIARFLDYFGLRRELDEMRRRVDTAVANVQNDGSLTRAEYLRESGLGEDEWQKGNLRAAYSRFTKLLEHIEALPEGKPLGRGSYEHCLTLFRLARCFSRGGQSAAAERRLREALVIIDSLIIQKPDEQVFIHQRNALLTDLGDILRDQGRYQQAREVYIEGLKISKQIGELRSEDVILSQLGFLALEQRDYAEARSNYIAALEIDRALGESALEAITWHQLGIVAQEQNNYSEAEQCYRESLTINERLGDSAGASRTCNQLAIITARSGRPGEAEGWYKRALELDELVQTRSPSNAKHLNNLADLLVNEVQAGRIPKTRLIEARSYAEQALAIKETLDASSEIWTTLNILAQIADLEGRAGEALAYRRRERETYAAFEGNRYHIDRQHGQLIADIAAVARGDMQAKEAIEEALPELEENGWKVADATRRIWTGERDWHALAEGLDRQDALLVLRVLETIEQPAEAQSKSPEQVIASLPASIREALGRGDQAAFQKAFEALSPEEQQAVMEAMQYLQAQQEEGEEEDEDDGDEEPDNADVLQQFEPLLQAIAVVAVGKGDAALRTRIESALAELEANGWHIRDAVQRIWNGERDEAALTEGLDEQDATVVRRVMEMIEGGGK
jgi:tetratricopeptide (TPR) repeat protein